MGFMQKIIGWTSGNGAEVNADHDLQVALPTANAKMAKMRFFSENDPGDVTGEPYVYSPETDDDFRLRTAQDLLLDTETFNNHDDGLDCGRPSVDIQSYQVPAATVNVAGRTLVIRGVTIDSYVQTALTGGGYVAQWSLAFGHTAVSLATTDAATTKAPVRIPLGIQTVASGAAALTLCGRVQQEFNSPIYVNPGEFVAVVKKKVGTAPSAGVIAHVICFDYGWV